MRNGGVVAVVLSLACLASPARGALVVPRTQAPPPRGDSALLPPDGFEGWRLADRGRVFTQADLYGHIDGGAELFLEFGFEQLTVQRYRSGGAEFVVEVYRMVDPAAATGVYLMKCGNEAPAPAFRERHTVGRYQLQFHRHRYYVIVNNVSGDEKLVPQLVGFATFIAGHLPPGQAVPLLALLPQPGLDRSSVRLVRGSYALQAIYTLGDGDMLQLGGKLTAVAGNYRDAAHGSYTLLLADYPTERAARLAFEHILAALDRYLTPITTTRTRLVFRDYDQRFGVVSVRGKRIELRVHLTGPPS